MDTVKTEAGRLNRARKNAKRKAARQRLAAGRALPPVVALSRAQYARLVGIDADYDAYADAFIAGARAKGRRYEFPLEPVGGAYMGRRWIFKRA